MLGVLFNIDLYMCMYLCTFSCYADAESSSLPFVVYFTYLLKDSIDGSVLCACFLGYSIDGCFVLCCHGDAQQLLAVCFKYTSFVTDCIDGSLVRLPCEWRR